MPNSGHKADIVTARNTINRAVSGREADLTTAAAMLDRVLMETCPHEPSTWHTAIDPADANGRQLVTCPACGVSWYEPERQIPDGSLRMLRGGQGGGKRPPRKP